MCMSFAMSINQISKHIVIWICEILKDFTFLLLYQNCTGIGICFFNDRQFKKVPCIFMLSWRFHSFILCEILDSILLRMIHRHNDVNMWQSFWWHPMYLFCCTGNDTKLEFENMIVTQVEIELFFMSKLGRFYKKLRRIRNGIFKCHHFNIYTEASLMFYKMCEKLKNQKYFSCMRFISRKKGFTD